MSISGKHSITSPACGSRGNCAAHGSYRRSLIDYERGKVVYDVPMQFISMKVEIRFLPDDMSSAYILYDGVHYPIRRTGRNENCRTRRDNPPRVDYAKLGGGERK